MNDAGYKTVHECQHDGVRHVVLHNPLTGGVIRTVTVSPRIYCCCPRGDR